MTREEAIANLKMIRVAFVDPGTKEQRKLINDTFEMAIQALSQEPTVCDIEQIRAEIKELATFENVDVLVDVMKIIDKYTK